MNICGRQFTVLGAYTYVNRDGIIHDYRTQPRKMCSVCQIFSGEVLFVSEKTTLAARKGDLVFTPIGTKYYMEWTGKPISGMNILHFTFPPMGNPFSKCFSQQIVKTNDRLDEDFWYLVKNFENEGESLQILSKFYGIVDEVYRMLAPDELPEISEAIQKARRFIEENCTKRLTIDEIATECGLSRSYFQHLFKAEIGMTAIEFKNRSAIAVAERMLSENREMSVEEVSVVTGFDSTAYFRRMFKRYTHKTPSSYRKKDFGEEPNYRY